MFNQPGEYLWFALSNVFKEQHAQLVINHGGCRLQGMPITIPLLVCNVRTVAF
jgi:hypothetical protein